MRTLNVRNLALRRMLRRKQLDQFAEMLAEGWTVTAAARALGVSQQAGSKMLRDIRAGLGGQAV